MDTFIPNMTLANIMHSNSNILPRSSFFGTHTHSHARLDEMLANIDFNALLFVCRWWKHSDAVVPMVWIGNL